MMAQRRVVRIFVSYAHSNTRDVGELLGLLQPRVGLSSRVDVRWWADSDLHLGEEWFNSIEDRIETCDFGLQMISPEFFVSNFIRTHEIPPFVGDDAKPTLPVGLYRVPLHAGADLAGFGSLQFFKPDDRWFGELTNRRQKVSFADELARKVLEAIDRPSVSLW